MKRTLARTTLLLLLALVLPRGARADRAPQFDAVTIDGDSVSLADFGGRVVLVEFWASWCPPCREQLPHAAALEDEFADLIVLAVSVDTRRDRVERFVERVRLPRRVLLDPDGHVAARFQLEAMPWAVLIGAEGEVLWAGNRVSDARDVLEDAMRQIRTSDSGRP